MEQVTEERYRDQVQRVFNRISLTGLPERDPGLSELRYAYVRSAG